MNISRSSRNFSVATAIGAASATLCWGFLYRFHLGGADFGWAQRAAHALLLGQNPYANTPPGTVPYPLPAALVALPFVPFPPELAAALFFGFSSGLLAFGLIRHSPERLLIFLAYPYWAALLEAQWTPLLMCTAFFPLAYAFCLAKPQIGAPLAFTHVFRSGLLAAATVLLASLAWQPSWPLEWMQQLHSYHYFVPLLILPGTMLALALWRWRDRDAWLLFLCSVVPQRWFYDAFVLWLIPKKRRHILATVVCSWVVGVWRDYHMPTSFRQVGLWCVVGFFLPMLVVVLLRTPRADADSTDESG